MARRKARTGGGFVYFIRCPLNGLIKVGWTASHPGLRLSKFRGSSPVPLEPVAMMPGGKEVEREFHARFAESRSHCEWFHPTPGLLALIGEAGPWADGGPKARRNVAEPVPGATVGEWALATALTVRGVTRSVAEWSDLTGVSPLAIKIRMRDRRDHDLIFAFDGPSTYHLCIKDKRSPEARRSRIAYEKWRAALTPEEWTSYTQYKRA